jgi:hypothetical protein
MGKSNWLDLTEAASVSKLSPWTIRRLCNNSENGIHQPLIPHKREGTHGQRSGDGRFGKILIHRKTAEGLRQSN